MDVPFPSLKKKQNRIEGIFLKKIHAFGLGHNIFCDGIFPVSSVSQHVRSDLTGTSTIFQHHPRKSEHHMCDSMDVFDKEHFQVEHRMCGLM